MFEDRCLVCGQYLADDGRAYCSDECENSDMYSPSISSSSSVMSSPQLGCTAMGAEVPSLVPSALGSALRPYASGNPYSISSSSSTSSASWSIFTDEECQDGTRLCSSDYSQPDYSEDPSFKRQNPSLSYVRKPSGTKTHSSMLQTRSRSRPMHGVPKSAPNHPAVQPDDGESSSDADFTSDHEASVHPEQDDRSTTAKIKRTRNRASLPACFSLLQIASPSKPRRSSPISCSSGNTIVRQSPPTPKLVNKNADSFLHVSPTIVPLTTLHDTPRGRRQDPDYSSCSRRSQNSSQSRSRSRRRQQTTYVHDLVTELSPKRGLDWSIYSAGLASRGRPPVRRSHSPVSRMISEVEGAMNTEIGQTGGLYRQSESRTRTRPRPRGRTRVDDLDGIGSSMDGTGYGNGRSGLVNRERGRSVRIPL